MGKTLGTVAGALTGLGLLCTGGFAIDRASELYDQTRMHVVDNPVSYTQDVNIVEPFADAINAFIQRDYRHIDDHLDQVDIHPANTPLHDRHMQETDYALSSDLVDHSKGFLSDHWEPITGAAGFGLAFLLGGAAVRRRKI